MKYISMIFTIGLSVGAAIFASQAQGVDLRSLYWDWDAGSTVWNNNLESSLKLAKAYQAQSVRIFINAKGCSRVWAQASRIWIR